MNPYQTAIDVLPRGSAIQLYDVSWDEYEKLLQELDERPYLRLTYDQGNLNIMTISAGHDGFTRLFGYLILVLAEELNFKYLSRGSTTLQQKNVAGGVEGDDCFYFSHLAEIAKKKRLDLTIDAPPDLVIEVDVTHPSVNKFPIYARLGIPEIWWFNAQTVKFYQLNNDDYEEVSHSPRFLFLAATDLPEFLLQGKDEDITDMVRALRQWVKAHKN